MVKPALRIASLWQLFTSVLEHALVNVSIEVQVKYALCTAKVSIDACLWSISLISNDLGLLTLAVHKAYSTCT